MANLTIRRDYRRVGSSRAFAPKEGHDRTTECDPHLASSATGAVVGQVVVPTADLE